MDDVNQKRMVMIREWRDRYHALPFLGHREFYSRFWATDLPPQRHYDLGAALCFLQRGARAVCEVGGWDGALAASALDAMPDIRRWANYEVCKEAADAALCLDPRYEVRCERWVWDDDLSSYDTLFASHSIEHLSEEHLGLLLDATAHMARAYVQVPNNTHAARTATHVLGLSVEDLVARFEAAGWRVDEVFPGPAPEADADTVVWFSR